MNKCSNFDGLSGQEKVGQNFPWTFLSLVIYMNEAFGSAFLNCNIQ